MRFEVEIDGQMREVILQPAHGCFLATVDGRERRVDAVRVDAHTWSLLVEHESGRSACSYEVSIIPEPAADRFAVHVGPVPECPSMADAVGAEKPTTDNQPRGGRNVLWPPCPGRWSASSSKPGKQSMRASRWS